MAFVGASALATGTTTVLPVYASAQAGNLLVAFVEANQAVSASFTLTGATTGWTQRQAQDSGNSSVRAEIWDKIAVGSDTMPTWNGGTTVMSGCVAEFNTTTVLDQTGGTTGTTGPNTVTASGTDGGTGRLIVAFLATRTASTAFTQTNTDNVNALGVGVGINIIQDNGGTSLVGHHRSIYVTTATTGGSADNDAMTWSPTTATNHAALCIQSYTVNPQTVTPGNLALVLNEFAPAVLTPRLVTPGNLPLTTAGFAPLLRLPRLVTPGVLGLVASPFAPTVTATGAAVSANPLPDYIQALQEQVARGWMPIPPPSKLD